MTKETPTPIYDFLRAYDQSGIVRMHMPGHKGKGPLGVEGMDITEVMGADTLYCPQGIIADSEAIATRLFGTQHTFYSCGGCSQSIVAAMWLLRQYAAHTGRAPLVTAARNVHQAFVSALADTGLSVDWLRPADATALSCPISASALEAHLRGMQNAPVAVYVTSPDYQGNLQPVKELAEVCHRYGTLLMVDNAHGAYLHFLYFPMHPIDLGADIVCDSAHKTLPVLTGGAYLHFGKACPAWLVEHARDNLLTAGSTSPSYLILASLDYANRTLSSYYYRQRIYKTAEGMRAYIDFLSKIGWLFNGSEPFKLALDTAAYGYTGEAVAAYLAEQGIMAEYADRETLVLMVTADTTPKHMEHLFGELRALPRRDPLTRSPALPPLPHAVMSVRDAYLSPRVTLPIAQCIGRTLAYLRVNCPPAVPPVIAGEQLTPEVIAYLSQLGYTQLDVLM